jgi:hypothetical protein
MRTPVTQAFIKLPHFVGWGNRGKSSKSQEISKRLKKLTKIHLHVTKLQQLSSRFPPLFIYSAFQIVRCRRCDRLRTP